MLTYIKVLFPTVLAYDNVYTRTRNYNESDIVHILACILCVPGGLKSVYPWWQLRQN